MSARARWIILSFALLGLGFASASTYVHYRLLTDPGYISPCDVSATFNCTQAYLSRFGSMFGVPVALGGVAWFALVALISAFAKTDKSGESNPSPVGSYLFGLATIGLAAILYLGFASWHYLKVYCLLCMGTYASVIGIFITSGLTASVAMGQLPIRIAGDLRTVLRKPAMLTIALIYIVAAVAGVARFPREMTASATPPAAPGKTQEQQFETAWNALPRIDIGASPGTAKVVVVKYNDWLCPTCKAYALAYEPVLNEFEKSNPGAVKMVIKDWPLNTACNSSVSRTIPGHEGSCDASVAVRLARDRGKGDQMIDWLFSNQSHLAELGASGKGKEASQAIRDHAKELGITDFDRDSALKLGEIRRDVADAVSLQLRGTPTFIINGVRLPGDQNLPPEYFDLALKIELKKAGGKP